MAQPLPETLNILVYGAGAIGTYIGGSLTRAGHQALFLERPASAAELLSRGLTVELPEGVYHQPQPTVAKSLGEALKHGPFDVVLFAIKSFDTAAAAASMAEHLQPTFPPVLCLQNGVENEVVLRKTMGSDKVIPGTVTSAIGRRAVGHARLERLRGVGVANEHDLAPRLVAALSDAGLQARLYPDGSAMKWSKLLINLIANASAAILDMTPAEVFAHPDLFRLELAQLREALAVMKALGNPVVDLPGTPTRALALAVKYLPVPVARLLLGRAIGRGRGGKMPSFHIDLHSGRGQSEVDYLNGAVARFGTVHHVPTPVNQHLTDILTRLTKQELPLDKYHRNPAALLDNLKL
jgi:2-dehydropantoate 2-reductase